MKLGGHFTKRASDMGERVGNHAGDAIGRASDAAEELVDDAADAAGHAARKARRAGRHLRSELNGFFDDVEDLVRRSTDIGDGDIGEVRARVENGLHAARDAANRGMGYTLERSRRAARVTDEYVHGNPWTAIGAMALVGLAVGAMMQRRLH